MTVVFGLPSIHVQQKDRQAQGEEIRPPPPHRISGEDAQIRHEEASWHISTSAFRRRNEASHHHQHGVIMSEFWRLCYVDRSTHRNEFQKFVWNQFGYTHRWIPHAQAWACHPLEKRQWFWRGLRLLRQGKPMVQWCLPNRRHSWTIFPSGITHRHRLHRLRQHRIHIGK